MLNYLYMIGIAIIIILILKIVFKISTKLLKSLIVNAISGTVILWVLNFFHIVSIPINIVSVLITGILGIPGVIILVILKFIGVL